MKRLLVTLPHSAKIFGEEPNSSNPKPPYSPDFTICKAWFFQGFRIGHPQKKLNRPRQQVSQPAISKEDCRRASSNGQTNEPNMYVQKCRTFRMTMFHSIHILFITNYKQVPETSLSSNINIPLVFSFHWRC